MKFKPPDRKANLLKVLRLYDKLMQKKKKKKEIDFNELIHSLNSVVK